MLTDNSPSHNNKENIFSWQVAHLYSSTKIAVITNATVSIIVTWLLWNMGVRDNLFVWLSSIWLVLTVRVLVHFLYIKTKDGVKKTNTYCKAFAYAAALNGFLWGITPWLFGDPTKVEIAIFLGFVIGGLISGATGILSVLSRVYFPYLIFILIPMASWFLVQDDPLHYAMALLSFLSVGAFLVSSWSYKKILRDSFELTITVSIQKYEVERASKAKSEFLSNMSHELRTPLNAILGFAQLISLNKETGILNKQHANEVVNAGKYLLSLIDDLLEISTIEANKLELNIESIKATAIIDECISLISASDIDALNVSIIFDKSGCNELNTLVDSIRLKQVLLNLLSNACKYNKQNGSITINCKAVNKSKIRISITDTGQGIPLDKQSNVFDSYQRLGQEHSDIKGTGLGLIISRQLVEKMGGKLNFESQEGQGSSFWVELPLDTNER